MRCRSVHRPAVIGWLAIGFVWMLVASSSALAVLPPTITAPPSPSQATDWSFGFASVPDPLSSVTYEGGLVATAAEEPAGAISSPFAAAGLAEGAYFFKVRAVQLDGLGTETRTAYSIAPIRVDRTPPKPPIAVLPPPNGTNGWYTSLTVKWTCADPSGATCPAQVITVAKKGATARQTAVDGAGNVSAEGVSPPFNFDNGMELPVISSPSNAARVAGEPTFKWAAKFDTSGLVKTEVYARWPGVNTDQLIARALDPATSATRNVRPTPLPEGAPIRWFIKSFDVAGNSRVSDSRTFTILPTPPSSAPTITGGPSGPTNNPTPTFSWSGDQPSFQWDVTLAGAAVAAQQGNGPARQVTLGNLPDGDYAFGVSQVTALNVAGPEVTQTFTVDTARPAAPVITGRPAAPTTVPAAFAWITEGGAFSRWQVLDVSGAVVKGPSDAVFPSVNVGTLPSGGYTFRVTQIDAAGNESEATSEGFTVQGGGAVTSNPSPRKNGPVVLPAVNAGRLTPRPGRRIATLHPMFQWTKGPAGTTLYNLQLFRVTKRQAGKAPTIVKILSVFPKVTSYHYAKGLSPGQCYVWRIWPYAGSSFTKKPLGISNFCVVSAKVIARNAARVKARARARHQAGGARVG